MQLKSRDELVWTWRLCESKDGLYIGSSTTMIERHTHCWKVKFKKKTESATGYGDSHEWLITGTVLSAPATVLVGLAPSFSIAKRCKSWVAFIFCLVQTVVSMSKEEWVVRNPLSRLQNLRRKNVVLRTGDWQRKMKNHLKWFVAKRVWKGSWAQTALLATS